MKREESKDNEKIINALKDSNIPEGFPIEKEQVAVDFKKTIYSTRIEKVKGGFINPLTISEVPVSGFRLTGKNKNGKYCRVECVDSLGNYMKGIMAQYICNDTIEDLVKYDFITDYRGNIIQERGYDENNNLIYIRSIISKDNDSVTEKRYIKPFILHEKRDTLCDANAFGFPIRSGRNSDVRFYKGLVEYTPKGDVSVLYGRDEFDEPDYITSDYITYYYQKLNSKSEARFFDEENNEIKRPNELKDYLTKVMTVEIVDSVAYNLGLRNNDIILSYGDYCVNLDAPASYFQFRGDWALHTILGAREKKQMVVFRIKDASKNDYSLERFYNLEGTPSELGFLPHIRYLTKKQTARIKEAISKSDIPLKRKNYSNKEPVGEHCVIMAFIEMYRSNADKPYATLITDPAILLAANIKDKKMCWHLDSASNVFQSMLDTRKRGDSLYPVMDYYLTKDMQSFSHIVSKEQTLWTDWFITPISDENYKLLSELIDSVKIKNRFSAGEWNINSNSNNGVSGCLTLSENGICSGKICCNATVFKEEYRIEKDYTGEWQYYDDEKRIVFRPKKVNDKNITVYCGKKKVKNKDKEVLLKEVGYIPSDEYFINEFDKQIIISDRDGICLTLTIR